MAPCPPPLSQRQPQDGAIAQLGERVVRNDEVGGSIPPGSTTLRPSGYAWRSRAEPEGRSVVPGVARRAKTGRGNRCGTSTSSAALIFPEQEYIGATADLKRRLPEHNAGKSAHTSKFKPWKLVWYCAFQEKYKALAFEKYLKSRFRKEALLAPLTPRPSR